MIEVKVSIEEDVIDKKTNLTTTIGSEETFALPKGYSAVDRFTLIRGVRDFLKKTIPPHDEDASPEDQFEDQFEDLYGEHWGEEQ